MASLRRALYVVGAMAAGLGEVVRTEEPREDGRARKGYGSAAYQAMGFMLGCLLGYGLHVGLLIRPSASGLWAG